VTKLIAFGLGIYYGRGKISGSGKNSKISGSTYGYLM
jgi:hypothetical protein